MFSFGTEGGEMDRRYWYRNRRSPTAAMGFCARWHIAAYRVRIPQPRYLGTAWNPVPDDGGSASNPHPLGVPWYSKPGLLARGDLAPRPWWDPYPYEARWTKRENVSLSISRKFVNDGSRGKMFMRGRGTPPMVSLVPPLHFEV